VSACIVKGRQGSLHNDDIPQHTILPPSMPTCAWLDGWMNGWMDGWMDGWLDGWMNGWMVG